MTVGEEPADSKVFSSPKYGTLSRGDRNALERRAAELREILEQKEPGAGQMASARGEGACLQLGEVMMKDGSWKGFTLRVGQPRSARRRIYGSRSTPKTKNCGRLSKRADIDISALDLRVGRHSRWQGVVTVDQT